MIVKDTFDDHIGKKIIYGFSMRNKIYIAIVAFSLLGWLFHFKSLYFFISPLDKGAGYDFFHYYVSVQALESGLVNIYDSLAMRNFSSELSSGQWSVMDNHPLPFYLFFIPYKYLDFNTSFIIHTVLQYIFMCTGLYLLSRDYLSEDYKHLWILLSVGCLSWGVVLDNLWLGQIGGLYFLSLVLCLYAYRRDMPILLGFTLSVSVLLKIYPLIFVLWLIKAKDYRSLLWLIFALALSSLGAYSYWGWERLGQYFNFMLNEQIYPVIVSNQSLIALIKELLYDFSPLIISVISVSLLSLGSWYLFVHVGTDKEKDLPVNFCAWLIFSLIISPISWAHHHLVLLIPFFIGISLLNSQDDNRITFIELLLLTLFVIDGESFHWDCTQRYFLYIFVHKFILVGLCILLTLWLKFVVKSKDDKYNGN